MHLNNLLDCYIFVPDQASDIQSKVNENATRSSNNMAEYDSYRTGSSLK